MKAFKKISAVIVSMAMIFAMAVPAYAIDDGEITITNAQQGESYTLYKLLDMTKSNPVGDDEVSYSYTIAEHWAGFFATDEAKAVFNVVNPDGSALGVGETPAVGDYVFLVDNDLQNDAATLKTFAAKAIEYATTNSVASVETLNTAVGSTSVVFDDLAYGYYLIDTANGTICSLTTAEPTATALDKNGKPTLEKYIVGTGDTNGDGVVNDDDKKVENGTAQIGDTISFEIDITVPYANNTYTLWDVMDESLSFNAGSIEVYVDTNNDGIADGAAIAATSGATTNYTVYDDPVDDKDQLDADGDENVDYTFSIKFLKEFLNEHLNETIIVKYTAKLTENASISGDAAPDYDTTNVNVAYLEYGDTQDGIFGDPDNAKPDKPLDPDDYDNDPNDPDTPDTPDDPDDPDDDETNPQPTIIKTYSIPIYKYTGTLDTATEKPLSDAVFNIYKGDYTYDQVTAGTAGDKIQFAEKVAVGVNTTYVIDTNNAAESGTTLKTDITSPTNGTMTISGLNAGQKYTLVETTAPDGYNKVDGVITFTIDTAGKVTFNFNGTQTNAGDKLTVQNNSGDKLPETGATGTLIFTIVGAGLITVTAVLMITRKKMSVYED